MGHERLRVLSASGQLGFGIVQESFERGLERKPHFIGCDMGSIDPGPFYLGSGQMAAPRDMVRRDLEMVLKAARQLNVPLIIGSAGTAGAKPHLEDTLSLLKEVAEASTKGITTWPSTTWWLSRSTHSLLQAALLWRGMQSHHSG